MIWKDQEYEMSVQGIMQRQGNPLLWQPNKNQIVNILWDMNILFHAIACIVVLHLEMLFFAFPFVVYSTISLKLPVRCILSK